MPVQYVADDHPDRIACLERTMAIVLGSTRLELYLRAQLGAGVDPLGFHAWSVTTEGEPIRLPYEEPITERYYAVLRYDPTGRLKYRT